jgi:hypothetical protein
MPTVATVFGAVIVGLLALTGIVLGAHYASLRLIAQLDEQRRWEAERRSEEARRLQVQLDAESARLRRQLDAEAARLDKQLAHDRWTREAEELRRLVDDAAAAGLAAGIAVHDYRGQVRRLVETGEHPKFIVERMLAAQQAVDGLQGFVERFELRMGRRHQLPNAYGKWQLSLEHAREALEGAEPENENLEDAGKLMKEGADLYVKFMNVARDYVQLQPPSDDVPF